LPVSHVMSKLSFLAPPFFLSSLAQRAIRAEKGASKKLVGPKELRGVSPPFYVSVFFLFFFSSPFPPPSSRARERLFWLLSLFFFFFSLVLPRAVSALPPTRRTNAHFLSPSPPFHHPRRIASRAGNNRRCVLSGRSSFFLLFPGVFHDDKAKELACTDSPRFSPSFSFCPPNGKKIALARPKRVHLDILPFPPFFQRPVVAHIVIDTERRSGLIALSFSHPPSFFLLPLSSSSARARNIMK